MEHKNYVSVIIPVYNASKLLPRCLESLKGQTYPYIELVMVDDCSSDNSPTLIHEFAESWKSDDHRIQICTHETNMGVAAARNTGLAHASGEYIYFMDADDFLQREALRQMVREMETRELDIVGIEWFLTFSKNERYMRQADFKTPNEALKNMMCGVMRWNLWLFMFKRSLFVDHNIRCTPRQDMGEDMMMVFKLFTMARKAYLIKRPFYHYQQGNPESLTGRYDADHREQVTHNVQELERFLKEQQRTDLLDYLSLLKLNIKLPLLVTGKKQDFELWKVWFPETNGDVTKNPKLPFRVKFLQQMAARDNFMAVRLYNILIFRMVYGLIYR